MRLLQRPSLWTHIEKWDQAANGPPSLLSLNAGPKLVLHPALIHEVFIHPENYREQSAFLRTRSFDPLPEDARRHVLRGLMSALTDRPLDPANVPKFLLRNKRSYATQQWGIRYMRHLYAPALNRTGDVALDELINFYVERKIIADDVSGGFRRLEGEPRDALHDETGAAVERIGASKEHRAADTVTAVADLGDMLPRLEKGELFLRLVQAVVAFTGSAFEWNLLGAARNPGFRADIRSGRNLDHHLFEAQRLFPTAWRLVRVVEKPHLLGGVALRHGDELILATTALHRSRAEWAGAEEYQPERWSGVRAGSVRSYAPFGRGKGMCPGRELAIETMALGLRHVIGRFEVLPSPSLRRKPYVRSILASPITRFRLVER